MPVPAEPSPCGGRCSQLPPLPAELLALVARADSLHAVDLLSLSHVSRGFRAATDAPLPWSSMISRHLQPILDAFFDGEPPAPRAGLTWKQHFFDFRRSWKQLAQQRTGRLLVQIGTQQPSGRGRYEVLSLASLWSEWGREDVGALR